jgi:hypothetical protein
VSAVVRGIASLAMRGTAGRSPLAGLPPGPPACHHSFRLDGREVRAAARRHGVGTTVLVLATVAGALHRMLDDIPVVRAMVPLTTRTGAFVGSRADGNRTAAVSLDLPTGPMSLAERASRIDAALTAAVASGQPEGGAAVLTLLGLLPGPVQAVLARLVYGRRFFHALASVMPGARRPVHVNGHAITQVHPVLPLADGVGVAVGALHWGPSTSVGVTIDPRLTTHRHFELEVCGGF